MRVIAGKFRSRPLHSLRGMDLRPTADRLRETLFNVLGAGNAAAFEGKVWFDLCAGTGAVGIEALSRGAAKVYFVESSPSAATLIRRNLDALKVESGFEVLKQDVARALLQLEARNVTADFIFLDPPYRLEKVYAQVLQSLRNPGCWRRMRLSSPNTIRGSIPATPLRPCFAIASWSRETRR